jgi:hypothetical protein
LLSAAQEPLEVFPTHADRVDDAHVRQLAAHAKSVYRRDADPEHAGDFTDSEKVLDRLADRISKGVGY